MQDIKGVYSPYSFWVSIIWSIRLPPLMPKSNVHIGRESLSRFYQTQPSYGDDTQKVEEVATAAIKMLDDVLPATEFKFIYTKYW